jgi:membrane protease YdiL (CAAX protease family)
MDNQAKIICSNCNELNEAGQKYCKKCCYNLISFGRPAGSLHDGPRFLPPEILSKTPWPWKYIALGICFLLILETIPFTIKFANIMVAPWQMLPYMLITAIFFDGILILFSVYILKKLGLWSPPPAMPLLLIMKETGKALFALLLIVLAMMPLLVAIGFTSKEKSGNATLDYIQNIPGDPLLMAVFLTLLFTLVPVAEELFFRGFLYNALKSRMPVFIAVIVQAIAFAIVHPYSLGERIFVFLLGIGLAIVYEKRKSLIAPIFVHGVKNAVAAIPVFILLFNNYHIPASDWDEAKANPAWVLNFPSSEITRQPDGIKQLHYAIDTWGSKGSQKWKEEINGFKAVCYWFPDDRDACAKAKVGIVTVYVKSLKDYRRAVVEADRFLMEYPEKNEQFSLALSNKGMAYLMLRDFKTSRTLFNIVKDRFQDYSEAYKAAQQGIALLDKLEAK